jgi:tetratricopeptide (TPR) repeat protein
VLHVTQSFLITLVMFVVAGPLTGSHRVRLGAAIVGAATLAVFDEWQQQWFGSRSIETADVLAGFAGVGVASAAIQTRRTPRLARAALAIATVVALSVTISSFLATRHYNWGLLAQERGDMAGAYGYFVAAYSSGVRTARLFNALAWTAVESGAGSAVEAVRHAEASLRLEPGNADALDTYGWALHKAGRSADAVAPLTEALRLNPRIYCIHYHLGAVYYDLGRHDLAREHLRQQVAEQPRTREARLAASLLAGPLKASSE